MRGRAPAPGGPTQLGRCNSIQTVATRRRPPRPLCALPRRARGTAVHGCPRGHAVHGAVHAATYGRDDGKIGVSPRYGTSPGAITPMTSRWARITHTMCTSALATDLLGPIVQAAQPGSAAWLCAVPGSTGHLRFRVPVPGQRQAAHFGSPPCLMGQRSKGGAGACWCCTALLPPSLPEAPHRPRVKGHTEEPWRSHGGALANLDRKRKHQQRARLDLNGLKGLPARAKREACIKTAVPRDCLQTSLPSIRRHHNSSESKYIRPVHANILMSTFFTCTMHSSNTLILRQR